jgi:hypothetical protein
MEKKMRVVGIALLLLSASGIYAAQDVPASAAWSWTTPEKHDDVAVLASTNGLEKIEIHFHKHEFVEMLIRVPGGVAIKDPKKGVMRQLGQNKVAVTLVADHGKPISKEWGAAQDSESSPLRLEPKDLSDKPFNLALHAQQLTFSYLDESGNSVTAVFDVSQMEAQMKSHKAHTHHFGVMDVVGGITGG